MRSAVFLAACLILAVESGRLVRQVKEHVASQVCCRCQDSRALCNNDLAKPVDVVDLREKAPKTTTTISTSTPTTGTTRTTSTSLGPSTTTCDPLFGTGCSDDILFGSSEDYLDPVDEDYYEYDGSNPNDSVDPADIDYFESPDAGGGGTSRSKKVPKLMLVPGPTCLNNIDCRLFEDCSQEDGACGFEDLAQFVDLRSTNQRCRRGQVLCCNPVPGDLFTSHLEDELSDNNLDQGICGNPDLAATINFEFGLACGKRDSRVYYDAVKSETEGGEGEQSNPGEWPWSVLIFRRNETTGEDDYVGAGTFLDTDVVATTATKVREYVTDPGLLRVHLGDWDPKDVGPNSREEYPHVTEKVSCVRQHPQFNSRSLAYNVAVLKLAGEPEEERDGGLSVADVVRPRTAPRRPADRSEGVTDWSRNKAKIDDGLSIDPVDERERRRNLLLQLTNEVDEVDESFVPPSYINTACLPIDNQQFQFIEGQRCWVSAWGNSLHEQRELEVPLVSKAECNKLLKPEFARRGVTSWPGVDSSEVCAGGEGKDACEGEGGAPLVCLDKARDQYFVVGLVNYGFTCSGELPAVYVNMGDPVVKRFITSAFNQDFCESTNS